MSLTRDLNEWLRGRVIRWLAGNEPGNGQGAARSAGVTLGIQGAHHVTVDGAGQVYVTGGYVVARGCQIRQDSTGAEIMGESGTKSEKATNEVNIKGDEIKTESEPKKKVRNIIEELVWSVDARGRDKNVKWSEHNKDSDKVDEI